MEATRSARPTTESTKQGAYGLTETEVENMGPAGGCSRKVLCTYVVAVL